MEGYNIQISPRGAPEFILNNIDDSYEAYITLPIQYLRIVLRDRCDKIQLAKILQEGYGRRILIKKSDILHHIMIKDTKGWKLELENVNICICSENCIGRFGKKDLNGKLYDEYTFTWKTGIIIPYTGFIYSNVLDVIVKSRNA